MGMHLYVISAGELKQLGEQEQSKPSDAQGQSLHWGTQGQQIGNYVLRRRLNRGATGSVYEAQHAVFDDEPSVALKHLHAHLIASEDQHLFLQEARIMRRLKHPNILPILDAGMHGQTPYIVMALATGGSLRDRQLARAQQYGGQWQTEFPPFASTEIQTILTQLGTALYCAHEQNIVHRDLKPENILFHTDDTVLLADFGIAAILDKTATQYLGRSGTPYYMAPEQFEGYAGPRSDQYALACVAYELLTGERPFKMQTPSIEALWYQHTKVTPAPPSTVQPYLPTACDDVLLKALQKKSEQRYPDIQDFTTELCQVLATIPDNHQTVFAPINPTTASSFATVSSTQEYAEDASAPALHAHPLISAHMGNDNPTRLSSASEQANPQLAYQVQQNIQHGKQCYAQQHYIEALQYYEEAIALAPHNAAAYFGKGKTLVEIRDYPAAHIAYKNAIQLAPEHAECYAALAVLLHNHLHRYEEALTVYQQALELDPNNAILHCNQGATLYELGRPHEALQCFELAIRLNPNDINAYINRATVLSEQGSYTKALVTYQQALKIDPTRIDLLIQAGTLLRQLARYNEALRFFEAARQCTQQSIVSVTNSHASHIITENRLTIYLNIALLQKQNHRFSAALEAINYAIQLAPRDAELYNDKGAILRAMRNYSEALQAYDCAIALDPNNSDAHNNRGNILHHMKRYHEALQAYDDALRIDPHDASVLHNRTVSLLAMRRARHNPT
jgi:serine/threonine-protein kinase